MRNILLAITLGLALVSCSNGDRPSDQSFASRLVGSWDLVEYDRRDESGAVAEAYYGNNPLGNIIYTASGDMSVHLVDPRIGEFESRDYLRGTPTELEEAYEGYYGYFGTYTVDEDAKTVTHHVIGASFRGYTGSDQTRFFELEGNRLGLVSGVEIEDGVPSTFHLVWERRD